jgi:hypothetical protein
MNSHTQDKVMDVSLNLRSMRRKMQALRSLANI